MRTVVALAVFLGFVGLPRAGLSQVADSAQIRIMSFSISQGLDINKKSNLVSVAKFINENKFDLVALQDVTFEAKDSLTNQANLLAGLTKMHAYYIPSYKNEKNISKGVAILTSTPFEKSQAINLPNSDDEKPVVMGCVLLKRDAGLYFRFCTARLSQESDFDRAMQAAYINGVLGQSVQPVVLTLDLGGGPNRQPYFSFKDNWQDAAKGSLLTTLRRGKSGERHDFIFVRSMPGVRVKNYKVVRNFGLISGHYPIKCIVQFVRGTPPKP